VFDALNIYTLEIGKYWSFLLFYTERCSFKSSSVNIDNKITPLYKLTYKYNFPKYNENINLYFHYSTIKNAFIVQITN